MDMETVFENLLQTRNILYGEIIKGILKDLESIEEEIRFFQDQLYRWEKTSFQKSPNKIELEHVKWIHHELQKYTNKREKMLTILNEYEQRFYK